MKKILAYLIIFVVLSSWKLNAQNSTNETTSVAAKTYFLRNKKVMATYYDLAGRPILEWCNRPDILNNLEPHPYIRFYHYDGLLTVITNYSATLKNEKEIIFNNPQYPLIRVSKMKADEYVAVFDCFPVLQKSRFFIDDIPNTELKFVNENMFARSTQLINDDGMMRTELYPYFYITTQEAKKHKEEVKGFTGRPLFKSVTYYNKDGRIAKKEEYTTKDFTFSSTPVFKVKAEYGYIYDDPKTEHIFIRDKQRLKTFKILVRNDFH